ncbi:hypothetical protein OVA26_15045 [Microbacterium sp. SL62]|uniref:hypothetical protein n=1 Tax=Microbacterium sp. SL62 TaxID=2995139 RepID=UPI00227296C9|nr:hypothetical protein [Microbacterium sp. SL62]MCY1718252.1 hypothetical protein [Microbacterium sp. SL62]
MSEKNRSIVTLQMVLVVTGAVIAVGSIVVGATPLAAVGLMLIVAGLIIAFARWWQRRRALS